MTHRTMSCAHRRLAALRASVVTLGCLLVLTAGCARGDAGRHAVVSGAASSNGRLGIADSYPVIVIPAEKLPATRDFYVSQLGLVAVFESTWFMALGHRGDGAIAVALMAHDHPSSPPGPETFSGRGMFVTLQVVDAHAALRELERAGIQPVHPLTDEAWGQRRFAVRDPAGTLVDVVQQIAPAPGFWEKYSPAQTSRPTSPDGMRERASRRCRPPSPTRGRG